MRIAVFVDYWNFQLTLNSKIAAKNGNPDHRAKVDWKALGAILAKEACNVLSCDPASLSYEGCYIYTSYNPVTDEGKRFSKWATTWLNRQPGITVEIRERKPKALPKCPICHADITHCPHAKCGEPISATIEKGIDTLLVTDLIRFANSNSYDAAVLVSSDADMVPAVNFVQTLGKKIIQAGFPPSGIDLSTRCWGSFDVMKLAGQLERV